MAMGEVNPQNRLTKSVAGQNDSEKNGTARVA